MLLTNHTLTGIVLGLTIDQPALLAPTAVASHLALDLTPHFWFDHPSKRPPLSVRQQGTYRDPRFLVVGSIDFAISWGLTIAACIARPDRALHVVLGVVSAQLPDLIYIPPMLFGRHRTKRIPGYEAMLRFSTMLQWSESPAGIVTELVWAAGMCVILATLL